MRHLPVALALVTLIAADFGLAADPDAWTVYLAAREQAGGSKPGRLVDYSYDVVTTLPAGKNQVDVHGSVVVILPDLIRQELQTPQGPTQLFFDGVSAWQVLGGKRRDLPNEAAALQRAELARRHVLYGELPTKELVRYRREEQVDGRIVDVIEIIDVGGAPLRLYVDRESKDVVKHVYVGDIPGGGMAQVEESQSDFVDIDGFRFATRRSVVRNGESARTSVLSGIRVNGGVRREIVLR
ncbi:MAG: hypothetical protein O3A53_01920 [Acidobacteria bacterium]|nr:hypothetical protein [Acidobacteriota bacterium]MDA1233538.1 hypothetical protein [Acidobacteriota bacterium]